MKGAHTLANKERGIDQAIEGKRGARIPTFCRAQIGIGKGTVEKAASKSALTSCENREREVRTQ
jgi:hypothetical protein